MVGVGIEGRVFAIASALALSSLHTAVGVAAPTSAPEETRGGACLQPQPAQGALHRWQLPLPIAHVCEPDGVQCRPTQPYESHRAPLVCFLATEQAQERPRRQAPMQRGPRQEQCRQRLMSLAADVRKRSSSRAFLFAATSR